MAQQRLRARVQQRELLAARRQGRREIPACRVVVGYCVLHVLLRNWIAGPALQKTRNMPRMGIAPSKVRHADFDPDSSMTIRSSP